MDSELLTLDLGLWTLDFVRAHCEQCRVSELVRHRVCRHQRQGAPKSVTGDPPSAAKRRTRAWPPTQPPDLASLFLRPSVLLTRHAPGFESRGVDRRR